MKAPPTLSRNPPDRIGQDYARLRQVGIDYLEGLESQVWTDFNAHDPGITLLEVLCYALTDLSYRVSLPIADLVAEPPRPPAPEPVPPADPYTPEVLQRHGAFLRALEILPNAPVTENDLRKLIIDRVPEVLNCWLDYPSSRVNVRCRTGNQSFGQPTGTGPLTHYAVGGLYRIRVELVPRLGVVRTRQVLANVARIYHRHRALCEDLTGVEPVPEQPVALCADIELTEEADIEQVYARILYAIRRYLSPPLPRYRLDELLERGLSPAEIFQGPALRNGFLLDDDLDRAVIRDTLNASDLIREFHAIPGLKKVRRLLLTLAGEDDAVSEATSKSWRLAVPDGRKPVLNRDRSAFHFVKDLLPFRPDLNRVDALLAELEAADAARTLITEDLPPPAGRYREDLGDYVSVQREFPRTYGLQPTGLGAEASDQRRIQARQLQGFLLLFDQLLADYLAQLRRVQDLFSTDAGLWRSYYAQVVTGIGPIPDLLTAADAASYQALLDPLVQNRPRDLARRNRFLDQLLARFAERFTDYALQLQQMPDTDAASRLLRDKSRFIEESAGISRRRSGGFNLLDRDFQWDSYNITGVEHRVGRLLGFPNIRRRNLALMDTDLYEQIDSDNAADIRFRVRDSASRKILLSSSTRYATVEDAVAELRIALELAMDPANYRRATTRDERFYFNLVNGAGEVVARRIEYFVTAQQRDTAIDFLIEFLEQRYSREGLHVLENLLLRPRKPGDDFLPVCPAPDCADSQHIDPYSFRVQVMVSAFSPRLLDQDFRRLTERIIRRELPAHVLPRICFLDAEHMSLFEEKYRAWLKYRATHSTREDDTDRSLNELIAVLGVLHSDHPPGHLHDCLDDGPGENPVVLNRTPIGGASAPEGIGDG